jgi:hypothetical protein
MTARPVLAILAESMYDESDSMTSHVGPFHQHSRGDVCAKYPEVTTNIDDEA